MAMDAIELSIFNQHLAAICDEMGARLVHTAFSPNIRERLDFSCAVFDRHGRLAAQAAHIPVHLGSMAYALRDVVRKFHWHKDSALVFNAPWLGGTHLPDITLVSPSFVGGELAGFVANRAHHADIGAKTPGSMPLSDKPEEEGVLIKPQWLVQNGEIDWARLDQFVASSCNPDYERGDYTAQISACRLGVARMNALAMQLGLANWNTALYEMNAYAERLARQYFSRIPVGDWSFTDYMEPVTELTAKPAGDNGGQPPVVPGITEGINASQTAPTAINAGTIDGCRDNCQAGDRADDNIGDENGDEGGTDDRTEQQTNGKAGAGKTLPPLPVRVTLKIRNDNNTPSITADFEGSATQTYGNINCPLAVTISATYYVFRCLLPEYAPSCDGTFKAITVLAPEGLVNAPPEAAVAGGNVETSSRIVDCVLGALGRAMPELQIAASQGTMNNFAVGSTHDDTVTSEEGPQAHPRAHIVPSSQTPPHTSSGKHIKSRQSPVLRTHQTRPQKAAAWSYYETIGGGMGASDKNDGRSASQSHMTNTRNTSAEELEMNYPLRVRRYAVRQNSGGSGRHRGGDGIVREFEFLAPATVTLLTERRTLAPWGAADGGDGACGGNFLNRAEIAGKTCFNTRPGDRLTIMTPGGGGWGRKADAP